MAQLDSSHIIICEAVEEELEKQKQERYPQRVVGYYREDFLIDDAREVIREAYIAEEHTKTLLLAAKSFNEASQNALLKVLEEPPRNIAFILIAPSKAALLPTVRSRLPLVNRIASKEHQSLELSLERLQLQELFDFIKANERLGKHEAKALIEALQQKALDEKIRLSKEQLEAFENAYKLIHLNARLSSVLSMLLMKFLRR